MTQTLELQYFFDPFCGWCYGSASALEGLAAKYPAQLRMMPSGLFFDARPVSAIADHAWRNDRRIMSLTGQQYTELYHQKVLLAPAGVFTSAPATLAMQMLGERDAKLEPAFLHAVQIARYVDGRDTAKVEEVAQVAVAVAARNGVDLTAAQVSERLRDDAALRQHTLERIGGAQARMDKLGIRGVPNLVVLVNGKPTTLNGDILYHGPDRLMAAIDDLIHAA